MACARWIGPVLALLSWSERAGGQSPSPVRGAVEVIVKIRPGDSSAVEDQLAREGCRRIDEVPALGLLLVALPDDVRESETLVARLAAHPGVEYVEPNGWGEGGGFVVNDTYFGEQWHLDNRGQFGGTPGADIEAVSGWELARGSAGVLVAVLDSGLSLDHPEFFGRVVPGPDFVNDDDDPSDDHGHGTFVTSILAANADNAFGLAGVDARCTVMPVKVLTRFNLGSTMWLVQGLVFAADAGADVVNMSLIDYPSSASLREALQYARDAGCVLVACAGNGGIGDADRSLPGRSPLTISIGATTFFDARAWYSGTGIQLDFVAPGDLVPALLRSHEDTWVFFGGCSAATPVASGVVALALSIDPSLTHDEIHALLAVGAEDQVGPPEEDFPGRDDQFGNGRLNLFRTLCGLDAGGPAILPQELHLECPGPGGIPGSDSLVTEVLQSVTALDDLDPAPQLSYEVPAFLPLGTTVPVPFLARDACGNETHDSVGLSIVDTRAPALAVALALEWLDPLDGRLIPVGLQAETSDACDPAPEVHLSVHCDELRSRRPPKDAVLARDGSLLLRAAREDSGDGRVYLCQVRSTDDYGNVTTGCATVVVPYDGDPASLEAVLLQADEARQECDATGHAPAGFSLLAAGLLPRNGEPQQPDHRPF